MAEAGRCDLLHSLAQGDMKTKTQHTPGPWYLAEERLLTFAHGEVVGPNNEHICGLLPDNNGIVMMTEEDKANARLIAAAPELLAALENALNVMAGIAIGDLKTIKVDSPAIIQARAAIAKAKGQQAG